MNNKIFNLYGLIIHVLIIFILSLMIISENVNGYELTDNINKTDLKLTFNYPEYDIYSLNSTDYLYEMSIINNISYKNNMKTQQLIIFTDSLNRKVKVKYEYILTDDMLGYNVNRCINLSYENIKLIPNLPNKAIILTKYSNECNKDYIFNPFGIPKIIKLNENLIGFSDTKIYTSEKQIVFVENVNTYNINDFRVNYLEIQNNDNIETEQLTFTIQNVDDVFKNKVEINKDLSELNKVLRIPFEIAKFFLFTGNVLNIISDKDFYDYQRELLIPLKFLNILLTTIWNILIFIFYVGIVYIFVFVELLIFIIGYIQTRTGSIIDTISKFVEYNILMFENIGKVINFIYEKIVIKFVDWIRG